MRTLNKVEANQVAGSGWFMFVLPVVIGFCAGGPAGAVGVAGALIATTGAKNLEHLKKNGEIPTVDQIIN